LTSGVETRVSVFTLALAYFTASFIQNFIHFLQTAIPAQTQVATSQSSATDFHLS
jgi:hypothetical protein